MERNRYKPMICPICQDFYFSEWQDGDENCEFYCSRCGWKYDLSQAENHNLRNGKNKLSVNEYKEWYKSKIDENSKYDYSEENLPILVPHQCPVCAKYEFEDMGSHDICPYCGWEDDDIQLSDPDYFGGANGLSLNEYIKEYKEKINKNAKYKWCKK